jgi:hypothetical protein
MDKVPFSLSLSLSAMSAVDGFDAAAVAFQPLPLSTSPSLNFLLSLSTHPRRYPCSAARMQQATRATAAWMHLPCLSMLISVGASLAHVRASSAPSGYRVPGRPAVPVPVPDHHQRQHHY